MIFFFYVLGNPSIEAQTFDSFEALQINIYLRNMTVLEIKTKTLILCSSIWSETYHINSKCHTPPGKDNQKLRMLNFKRHS